MKGGSVVRKDEDKAKMLMDTFFPIPLELVRQTEQEDS
jgi:hypothetical protein